MPDIITEKDINWVNNFPRINKALLASFWVKMVLDGDLNSHLDSEQIIYNKHAEDHCPFEFWENTQFLIRSVCGERESLMGELYNKLNRKFSLHFDCYKSDRYEQKCNYIKGDRLFLKIGFPIVFDDSRIYSKCSESSDFILNNYIANGYANAEKIIEDINISDISNAINGAIQSIWEELNFLFDEDESSVKHLLKVALSYCYPTVKYNEKIFSALVDGQFLLQNQNKEISCKGVFLLWKPQTDLSSFIFNPIEDGKGGEKRMEFMALERFIAKEGAKETSRQMVALVKKESIKSAKAAIMSRNLSHNLGSHVMSYLKQNFNSVQEIVANGTLETIISRGIDEQFVANQELPLLVGMGKFISYLQERQDYIATVSTDYIPCPSIVNFKDAIYDELNPDYRFYRHRNNWTGHKPANILLQNIAKSEGLSRELLPDNNEDTQERNNIIIQFRSFDGLHGSEEKGNDYEELRKWNFSLPGGIMGRQAVFSIVENVIRNAAKHGSRQDGDNLILTFDIYDAIFESDIDFLDASDKPDLYVITLTDNVITDKKTVDDINKVLEKSFLDEGTDLTASNKGLKEMLISAAWLRGIRIEEQDAEKKLAPILKARQNKDQYLQYVFCLPKVKKVLFITDNKELLKENSAELNRLGWFILDFDDYIGLSNKNFGIIILDNALSEKYEIIRRCSNNRLFISSESMNYDKREIVFKSSELIKSLNNCIDKEEQLKIVETDLFRQIIGESNTDDPIRITISDKNIDRINTNKLRLLNEESNIFGEKYIYRTHNDSTKEFLGFLNTLNKESNDLESVLDGVEFIEGITGGNSTDRIVRRETKDDLWVYQQAHAMKTKVAVFDERIFTRITGYEMSQLKEVITEPIDWNKELDGKNLLDKKNYVNNYDFARKRQIKDIKDYFENWSEVDVVRFAQENYPSKDSEGMILRKILPLVYHKKGIDVFTITKISDETNCYAIWGIRHDFKNIITDTQNNDYKNNKYGCVVKIAELFFEDYTPRIRFSNYGEDEWWEEYKRYDYVTIHQGLLDKVYQKLPIEDSKDETDKKEKVSMVKRSITKKISDSFIKGKYDKDDYIPGLTIHSGRSKPNKKDMPQNQPFIQYSAIENAVLDCKYTLVELLDFASYE